MENIQMLLKQTKLQIKLKLQVIKLMDLLQKCLLT